MKKLLLLLFFVPVVYAQDIGIKLIDCDHSVVCYGNDVLLDCVYTPIIPECDIANTTNETVNDTVEVNESINTTEPAVQVCFPTCTDSDGGNNHDVKGIISGTFCHEGFFSGSPEPITDVLEDYCIDSNHLAEYECSAENPLPVGMRDVFCECEDGICVPQEPTEPKPIIIEGHCTPSCTDTDGYNRYTAGVVTWNQCVLTNVNCSQLPYGGTCVGGSVVNWLWTKYDHCIDDYHVLESYCDSCSSNRALNDCWETRDLYCRNGCELGACIR